MSGSPASDQVGAEVERQGAFAGAYGPAALFVPLGLVVQYIDEDPMGLHSDVPVSLSEVVHQVLCSSQSPTDGSVRDCVRSLSPADRSFGEA